MFGRRSVQFILRFILVVGFAGGGMTLAPAQQSISKAAGTENPLSVLGWVVTSGFSRGDPNGPTYLVTFDWEQVGSPDDIARRAPQRFQDVRRVMGCELFVFIEANIKPRYRRDLVPVMRIGPLGVFTDRSVPESTQRRVEQAIRGRAAQMPGGAFKLNDEPVSLGGREDLIRYLEEKDRERDDEARMDRAINVRKWSEDERQDKVLGNLLNLGLISALGGRSYSLSEYRSSSRLGPEQYFADLKKYGAATVARGEIPLLYAPADSPKDAMEGMPPLARIGKWGIWGSPSSPAADLSMVERILATFMSNEDFKESAYLLGVDDFGGPADLQQLVAQTPERKPVAPPAVASASPSAPAKPGAASSPLNGGDRRGSPLPGSSSVPNPGDPIRHDPPIPKPIYSKKGDLPTWQPLSDAEKAKHAKEQAEFNQKMSDKMRKIEDLKKQRAKEDADRLENNKKVMAAWIQEKKDEQDALNQRMIAKLRAAENQAGAMTYEIEELAGDPEVVWTNHTDVALYVEFTYTGTVDGVSVGELQGSTLAMSGRAYVREALGGFFGLQGKKYTLQILNIRWWAREQDNEWRY